MALKVGELFASFDLDASGMTGTIRTIETQLEGIGADMIRAGSTLSSMVTDPLKGIGKSILSAGMDFTSQMSRVEAISGAAKTGQIGDGKIFVYPIEQAVRIRTGETDNDAL